MTHTIPGGASRLAALVIAHICPICSLFPPCQSGAALRGLCKPSRFQGTSRMPMIEGGRRASGLQFAVVVSRYNDFVTDRLLAGAREGLESGGGAPADVTGLRVPGAYEIPIAAQRAAETGRFAPGVSLGG